MEKKQGLCHKVMPGPGPRPGRDGSPGYPQRGSGQASVTQWSQKLTFVILPSGPTIQPAFLLANAVLQ